MNVLIRSLAAGLAVLLASTVVTHAQQSTTASGTTFFVSSVGSGKGADFGGLEGADKHCQSLAKEAGAGNRVWRAYLSTTANGGVKAVNARDRIGNGPWRNSKGVVIAKNLNEL